MNHPLTRNSHYCPLCDGYKDIGLVACWPCYSELDLRHGNADAEAMIAQFEACLEDSLTPRQAKRNKIDF